MWPWRLCAGLLVVTVSILEPVGSQNLPPINPNSLDVNAAHVCQSTMNETYSQLETYSHLSVIRTNTWCLDFPPRCTVYSLRSSVAYRIATRNRGRKSIFCCHGYKPQLHLTYCVPSCDNDCFKNVSHGFCATPGNCVCNEGYGGQNCKSNCSAGTWGRNCSRTCNCGTHGSCDPVNGNCICSVGYTGADCSLPCDNSFGLNCVHPCVCENNASCNNVNGRCTCPLGFYGAYCHKKCDYTSVGTDTCSQTCPCQHGTCIGSSTVCQCFPGYKGQYCAEPCSSLEWGPGCQNNCTCYSGLCDSVTGQCLCNMGYAGDSCEIQCPASYYSTDCGTKCACQNGGQCYYDNNRDDVCNCTSTGYHGKQCSVRDCPYNKFQVAGGCVNCACQWNQTSSCHPQSGKCQCKPGFRGTKCASTCSMPYYGQDCAKTCQCANGDCDPVTGACKTCYPGYVGKNCDIPCTKGRWGQNCENECGCLNDADCHVTTGYCNCTAGYQGMLCGILCAEDRYGRNCQGVCTCDDRTSTCNPYNGSCECKPGYYGDECENSCDEGWYGYGCRHECSCYDSGTKECDIATGKCICKPSWKGVTCSSQCPDTLWGPYCRQTCECNRHGSCDQETGACLCYPGYQGDQCEDRCDSGFFGLSCTSQCRECPGLYTCNYQTGECTSDQCRPGFTGANCQTLCPHGYWGQKCANQCAKTCVQNGRCNPINGACLCYPGYIGSFCERKCEEGMFGVDCASTCPCERANTDSCDYRNGHCTCLNGYTGQFCHQSCQTRRWGPDCSLSCSSICDKSHSLGCDPMAGLPCICKPGYEGPTCSSPSRTNVIGQQTGASVVKEPLVTSIIIGVSVAILVLIVIIMLLVCFYRRKIVRMKEENLRVQFYANGQAPEQGVVENGSPIGVLNPTYVEQNLNNDRRYPHLSQRVNPPAPPPQRTITNPVQKSGSDSDEDFDDIAEEKLRVNTDVGGQYNKGYMVGEEDEEDRYTTLKSLSNSAGAVNTDDHNILSQGASSNKVGHKPMMFTGPKVPNGERSQSGATPSSKSGEEQPGFSNNTYDLVIKPSNIILATTVNQPNDYLHPISNQTLSNQRESSHLYDDIPAEWETFSAEDPFRGEDSPTVPTFDNVRVTELSQPHDGGCQAKNDSSNGGGRPDESMA